MSTDPEQAVDNMVFETPDSDTVDLAPLKPSASKSRDIKNPYTLMLGISLIAILIAIICLAIELGRYGFNIKPSTSLLTTPTVSQPVAPSFLAVCVSSDIDNRLC